MSQPVPEERNEAADLQPGDTPPGEHDGDLPDGDDAGAATDQQAENAESSVDQPSS